MTEVPTGIYLDTTLWDGRTNLADAAFGFTALIYFYTWLRKTKLYSYFPDLLIFVVARFPCRLEDPASDP